MHNFKKVFEYYRETMICIKVTSYNALYVSTATNNCFFFFVVFCGIKKSHNYFYNNCDFKYYIILIYPFFFIARNLLNIPIQNPIYCLKNVCKKLSIPMKYAIEAADLFQAQYGTDYCTAHDIYYGISEILYMLSYEGEAGSRITQMEETISRAINIDWKTYDVPGNF